jgi:Coenzyme PQQ synthesis protein D (PqqD)
MLLKRRGDLICREVDGKLVGLDPQSSNYFSLNPTGTLLWRQLEGGAETTSLVEALVEQHQVDPATAAADVQAFVDSLQEHELLG